MIESLYGIGLVFGFMAGLYLGLPAFVIGLIIALVAIIVMGMAADQGLLQIALHAFILATALEVSYVLGLCARAMSSSLRKRLNQKKQKPEPRKVD